MVTKTSVEDQLKKLDFNYHGWGHGEIHELHNVILPDEEILEVVNGFYEGGFAMLLATDVRVLLVDKKPMNYLTVEDLRFDMINEMDYSHRIIGAQISIASGSKKLKFSSLNQARLRKLLGHVQHHMATSKKKESSHQEDQKTHLEQINQQLQAYLVAQHQHQLQLQQIQQAQQAGITPPPPPEPVKPSPELSDFLFAQSLMAQYQAQAQPQAQAAQYQLPPAPIQTQAEAPASPQMDELYAEGMQEIFGKKQQQANTQSLAPSSSPEAAPEVARHPLEINPISVAYSKLPMALRNRKFGRPKFHAHSAAPALPPANPAEV